MYSRGITNPRYTSQNQQQQPAESFFTFKFTNEKLISIDNKDFSKDSSELFDRYLNADYIINTYHVSYTLKFDPSLNKYDNFSKKHHREKLFQTISEIDWSNEYKLKMAKKEVNPYENVFESYFDRRSSYKIANLNFLFKFALFNIDHIMGYTPVMIVGDDGGFSDYVMWQSFKNDFTTKIFVFPEKNNKISETKFRNEISQSKDENLTIINSEFLELDTEENISGDVDIDEMENFDLEKIKKVKEKILGNTDGFGISLYIARKFLKFRKEFSQELKYKKFLLLNVIMGLSVLSKGGNLVIKIYDTFTHFTISILFLLFNNFEKFTIVKPFSSRPHSSVRYIVCQKLTEFQPKILEYLNELYEKYLIILRSGKDLDFVYPVSKIIKDENFTNYLMEINSSITEQRIQSLVEIKNVMENGTPPKYDKMDIKKKCLDQWKIPVLHYDPRQVISNKNDLFAKKSQNFNKLISIQETARIYSELDKYSDSIQNMIDMFGDKTNPNINRETNLKKFNENKDSLKSIDTFSGRGEKIPISHEAAIDEELLRKKREMMMISEKKSSKSKKDERSFNKKTITVKKSKYDISHDAEIESKYDKCYDEKNDVISKKRKIIEESFKNREIVENKKVVLNDNLKRELEKFKKK